jgi:hypothetical protein
VPDESDESVSSPVSASCNDSGFGSVPPVTDLVSTSVSASPRGSEEKLLKELKSGLKLDKCIAITNDLPHDLPAAWIGSSSADRDCKRQQDGAQYKLHDAIVG